MEELRLIAGFEDGMFYIKKDEPVQGIGFGSILFIFLIFCIFICCCDAGYGTETFTSDSQETGTSSIEYMVDEVTVTLGGLTANLEGLIIDNNVLKVGNEGTAVAILQRALNKLGYNCGTADGVYGNATYEAVYLFQQDHSLYADGVAGPDTFEALIAAFRY